jgi:hypothetical protein
MIMKHIDDEEHRIAKVISKQYQDGEMNAVELGDRLKFLHEYAMLARRALNGMKGLERSL